MAGGMFPAGWDLDTGPEDNITPQGWTDDTPKAEDRNFIQRNLLDPAGRGWNQLQQQAAILSNRIGGQTEAELGANLSQDRADASQYPYQPDDIQLQQEQQAAKGGSFMGGLTPFLHNPAATARLGVESMVSSVPSIVGGAVGGAAGALSPVPGGMMAGSMLGAGLGSFGVESGSATLDGLMQAAQELGLPPTKETFERLASDPDLMAHITSRADKGALPVALLDGLSAGVAGRLMHPVAEALGGGRLGKLAGITTEALSQGGLGGAGEAGKQLVTDGTISSPSDVWAEALLELPHAGPEVVSNVILNKAFHDGNVPPAPGPGQQPNAGGPVPLAGQPAPGTPPGQGPNDPSGLSGVDTSLQVLPAGGPDGTQLAPQNAPGIVPGGEGQADPANVSAPAPDPVIDPATANASSIPGWSPDDENTVAPVTPAVDPGVEPSVQPVGGPAVGSGDPGVAAPGVVGSVVAAPPGWTEAEPAPVPGVSATAPAAAPPADTARPIPATWTAVGQNANGDTVYKRQNGQLVVRRKDGTDFYDVDGFKNSAINKSDVGDEFKVAGQAPKPAQIATADGKQYDGHFHVAALDDLVHATEDMQPRDRNDRAAYAAQVPHIVSTFNPEQMIQGVEASGGTPIVGHDNLVESGNGRVAALRTIYDQHPDKAEAYKSALRAAGHNIDGIERPVLVRRMNTPLEGQARSDFAYIANKPAVSEMSATEKARADQNALTDDVLAHFTPNTTDGLLSASNRNFVRAFVSKIPATEHNNLLLGDGQGLSSTGLRRLQGALLAKAYGDDGTLDRTLELTDDDAKSVTNAMVDAAGSWAQMRSQIDAGKVDKGLDITSDVVKVANILRRAREQGVKMSNVVAQAVNDMLDPMTPLQERLIRDVLFNNSTLTKPAGRAKIAGFLTRYAEEAKKASGGLLAAPTSEEVMDAALSSQGDMLTSSPANANAAPEPTQNVAVKQAPQGDPLTRIAPVQDQAAAVQEKSAPDSVSTDSTTDSAQAQAPAQAKIGRGGVGQIFQNVSWTNRRSWFEQAFRDAGLNPDEAVNLPPVQQLAVLKKLFVDRFGFASVDEGVKKGGTITARQAIDQLLDGYRNIQWMMHVLNMPLNAVSLGGKLHLSLDKFLGNFLGQFDGNTNTIHMVDRSNSFAHEWGHALDFWLAGQLGQFDMASHLTKTKGLDPNVSMEAAFINLMDTLFYDSASHAAKALQLQAEASKTTKAGAPTAKALTAQRQLDQLRAGNAKVRIASTDYHARAKLFGDPAYWANPMEMLARATEMYVAHQVELAGGTNEFITKGNDAYLNDVDRRLANTFPKGPERNAVIAALDTVMSHVAGMHGGVAASAPGNYDIVSSFDWVAAERASPRPGLWKQIKQEFAAYKNMSLREALRSTTANMGFTGQGGNPRLSAGTRFNDMLRTGFSSQRANMKAIFLRNMDKGGAFLRSLSDDWVRPVGEGRATRFGEGYGEAVRRRQNVWVTDLYNNLASRAGFKRGEFTEAENKLVRDILTVGDMREYQRLMAAAPDNVKKAAAMIRRALDDIWHEAKDKGGLALGYVRGQGFLPRSFNLNAIYDDATGFVTQMGKVFDVIWRNEAEGKPAEMVKRIEGLTADQKAMALRTVPVEYKALKDGTATAAQIAAVDAAARSVWANANAMDINDTIRAGSDGNDAIGPNVNSFKERVLPAEADALLADYYRTDVLDVVRHYAHSMATRISFTERFGQAYGNNDFEALASRNDGEIAAKPRYYNVNTVEGRLRIIDELGDVSQDNLHELKLREAAKDGAIPEDIERMRGIRDELTNRMGRNDPMRNALSLATAFGNMALLPRNIWSNMSEPFAAIMHLHSVRAGMEVALGQISALFRTASHAEWRMMTEAAGAIQSPYADMASLHRTGIEYGDSPVAEKMMTRFSRLTGTPQLTAVQRVSAARGSHYLIRSLSETILHPPGPRATSSEKVVYEGARAELREIGVADEAQEDFANWVLAIQGTPTVETIRDNKSAIAPIYRTALNNLVDRVIQEVSRVDKPYYHAHAYGRLAGALISFNQKFTQNVHVRLTNRMLEQSKIRQAAGQGKYTSRVAAVADMGTWALSGFVPLIMAGFVTSSIREALFNGDQWEKHRKDKQLGSWLWQLAASRSGMMGTWDPLLQAYQGVRYERDLTGLFTGPYASFFLGAAMDIIRAMPGSSRNSPNTNTVENKAAKGAYKIAALPLISWLGSALPTMGPLGTAAASMGVQYATSNHAADKVAGAFYKKPPPK